MRPLSENFKELAGSSVNDMSMMNFTHNFPGPITHHPLQLFAKGIITYIWSGNLTEAGTGPTAAAENPLRIPQKAFTNRGKLDSARYTQGKEKSRNASGSGN